MSLKEIIERGPLLRSRRIVSLGNRNWPSEALPESQKRRVLDLLDEAEIPQRLQELREVIAGQSPDVVLRIEDEFFCEPTVITYGIMWGFRESGDSVQYNYLGVGVRPREREIVIIGSQNELLRASEWSSPEILAGAFATGYSQPLTMTDSRRVIETNRK